MASRADLPFLLVLLGREQQLANWAFISATLRRLSKRTDVSGHGRRDWRKGLVLAYL